MKQALQQTFKHLQVILRFSMMSKTHTIKQAVKSLKTNEVELFIKDENRPNLYTRKGKEITKNIRTTTTIGLQSPTK